MRTGDEAPFMAEPVDDAGRDPVVPDVDPDVDDDASEKGVDEVLAETPLVEADTVDLAEQQKPVPPGEDAEDYDR